MTASSDSGRVSDKIDRRGFLECMAWAGTGLLWMITEVPRRGRSARAAPGRRGFSFAQISDSHVGFGKDPQEERDRHARRGHRPHQRASRSPTSSSTGDLTHLSTPREFIPSPKFSRVRRSARFSTCPVSTTSSATGRGTSGGSARGPGEGW